MTRDLLRPWGDVRQMRQNRAAPVARVPRYVPLPGAISADNLPDGAIAAPQDTAPVAEPMRYGDFAHQNFTADTTQTPAVLLRPQTTRTYLLIENTHASQSLYVGFGQQPSATIGVTIAAGGNYLCDTVVPQNDVFITGSGATTTGKITYCNRGYGQI